MNATDNRHCGSCGTMMERQCGTDAEGTMWGLYEFARKPSPESADGDTGLYRTGALFTFLIYRCPTCKRLELYDHE